MEEAGEEGEIQLSWWTKNLKYELLFLMLMLLKKIPFLQKNKSVLEVSK